VVGELLGPGRVCVAMTADGVDRLLSTGQVAVMFGVNPRTVNRWASEGRLGSVVTPGGATIDSARRRSSPCSSNGAAAALVFEHPGGDATRGDLEPLVPSVGLMPGCSSGGSSPGNVVEVARAGSVLLVPGIVPLLMSVAPSDGGPGRAYRNAGSGHQPDWTRSAVWPVSCSICAAP
jgi:hypothetical protein